MKSRYIKLATVLLLIFVVVDARLFADSLEKTTSPIAVHSIGLTVSDMDRSVAFYTDVLTFEKLSDEEVYGSEIEKLQGVFGIRMRVVRLRLGSELFELSEYLAPRGRPMPPDSRSNDQWFQHIAIVVSDMDRAYRRLRERKVRHASSGPQRLPDWNRSAAGIQAFYFKDPDGHFLEILQFPPSKGDARWHAETDKLFLGIDHTAIVVRDTEASLVHYRDTLGMAVVGESENYGDEQEHLNNVFGARLRITTLRATRGPGVELLEYLAPSDGRLTPSDSKANDLWHWQIQFSTPSDKLLEQSLESKRTFFVSPGVVNLPNNRLRFTSCFVTRDPDGHSLLFTNATQGDAHE